MTRPRLSEAVHCTLIVSATLMRSLGSAARQATIAGVAVPVGSRMRSISDRRSRPVQYQSGGSGSSCRIASVAIGSEPKGVLAGRPAAVAPPVERNAS